MDAQGIAILPGDLNPIAGLQEEHAGERRDRRLAEFIRDARSPRYLVSGALSARAWHPPWLGFFTRDTALAPARSWAGDGDPHAGR